MGGLVIVLLSIYIPTIRVPVCGGGTAHIPTIRVPVCGGGTARTPAVVVAFQHLGGLICNGRSSPWRVHTQPATSNSRSTTSWAGNEMFNDKHPPAPLGFNCTVPV